MNLTHLKISTLLLLAPVGIFMELVVLGGSMLGGWVTKKLKSYFALLSPRTIYYVLKKRREVQALRKISDKELVRSFVSKIEHQETDNVLVRYIVNPILDIYWKLIKGLIV